MSPVEMDPSAGLNGAVAGELRAMRTRRNTTNERISERSGIPLVSVNRYMAAKRDIKLSVLAELARAMDSDAVTIMTAALADLNRTSSIPDATTEATYTRDEAEGKG